MSYCCWGTLCLLIERKTLPFYTNDFTERNIFLVVKIRLLCETDCFAYVSKEVFWATRV